MESVEKSGGRNRLPLSTRLKLAGGAAAASLLFLIGCGSSGDHAPVRGEGANATRYDAGTESALRGIISPVMKKAARRIAAFALNHPDLTTTTVGRNQIDVTVASTGTRQAPDGSREIDRARLEVITGRLPSGGLDTGSVLAVSTYRSSSVAGDPSRNFGEGVDLYAPGGSFLGAGSGNSHIKGWSGTEILSTGTQPAHHVVYNTSGPDSKLVNHDPLATAGKVTGSTGSMIDYTRFDLAHAQGR